MGGTFGLRRRSDSTRKIRVLYCIEAMVHGGTEKQLAALISGLDRANVEPALCSLKPSTMNLAELDCEVIELGFRTFRSPRTAACLWRLHRFIRDRRVDVVQTFFQDPTLLGLLASAGSPVRARIATFRDMGFWRTRGKVAQLRLAYPCFDGFIANSHAVAKQAHALDGIPLERIDVVPNGVVLPPPRLLSKVRNILPVVGIVANLDRPVKRVDLFLEAARAIGTAIGAVEFVVVGDGHLRPALQNQAASLGIADRVRFLGSVKDPSAEIRRFDVGLLCSDSEGLSNAILEYMAAGVVTVARDVAGNREAVIDGETGRLVDSDRPEAIAAAVVGLLRDDGTRHRMGARARQIAERTFSMDAYVRRHEAIYQRLIAAPDSRRPRPVGVEQAAV